MVSATTCCTWPTSLVMRESSWPVERRAKKPADWLEHVRVQPVAQVADDPLADIGHQVVGEIPAKALEQIAPSTTISAACPTCSCLGSTLSRITLICSGQQAPTPRRTRASPQSPR